MPPPTGITCYPRGLFRTRAQGPYRPIDRRPSTPVLELQSTQAVPYPFIQYAEYPRCLGQLEIGFPARHITPQFLRHFVQVTSARPAGNLPDAPLEGNYCIVRDTTLDRVPGRAPQLVTEKRTTVRTGHRSLGFVHLQMEPVVELAQTLENALARLLTAHIHIAVVSVAHEPMATPLQFPIHLVQQHVSQQR